ncbi:MAG: hypothetical protein M3R04_03690 [bacterium]|nr:hypothetical protein [bacterium]
MRAYRESQIDCSNRTGQRVLLIFLLVIYTVAFSFGIALKWLPRSSHGSDAGSFHRLVFPEIGVEAYVGISVTDTRRFPHDPRYGVWAVASYSDYQEMEEMQRESRKIAVRKGLTCYIPGKTIIRIVATDENYEFCQFEYKGTLWWVKKTDLWIYKSAPPE